jgi:transcription elongation factor GreA
MKDKIILTQTRKAELEAELFELKTKNRLELAHRLKSAIEMGDLSENADYKAAKEDQAFLEGRIQEIEKTLAVARVVDPSQNQDGTIQIGTTATIQEDGGKEEVWEIVGASEADIAKRKISYQSPVGSALIGKKTGDIAEASLPNGNIIRFKILKVE